MADEEIETTEETEESSEEQTAEGESTEQQDTTDWKAMSRKHEKEARANSAAAKELKALKAKDQTDAERVTAERDTANAKVKTAIRRAVTAEVKSVAASLKFQDPADALRMIDLDDLTDDDGEVDDEAVQAALKGIAAAKPYLLATTGPVIPGKSGGEVNGGGETGDGEKSVDDFFKEFNKIK